MSYSIKAGDTLSAIAARNNTTVANLAKLNNISDPNKINAGQTIKLS
jgi:LysM repeat protein